MPSPATGADGVVTLEIKSDGQAIPDTAAVVAVRVRAETNRIPEAVITLLDGDVATGEFPLTDGGLFKPGKEITISAGYGNGSLAQIFKGPVVAQRLRITGEGEPRLEVGCRDKAFKLTLGRRNRTHLQKKDSDAIQTIIGEAGLTATVTATTATHPEVLQYHCSDWDFLLARAEANSLVVNVDAGAVKVEKPDASVDAALTVTFGVDLLRFDAEVDARGQYASVEATSWDPATQAVVSNTAQPTGSVGWGDLTETVLAEVGALDAYRVQTAAPLDSGALKTVAEARRDRAALARQRGEVAFQGSALAKPGAVLELKGLGTRFGGKALIGRVVHRIDQGNWVTEAGLGLPGTLFTDRMEGAEAPPAAGIAPPVRGLQIGVVLKVNEDPNGAHRIQVELPLQGAGEAKVWARLGTPYATNGSGIMFLPEVSDEVVLGFLSDDPSFPVVLGVLHSSKNPPPEAAAAENYKKTILTKAKLKIAFDDEKKIITLATPAGNTAILNDEGKSVTLKDETGNKIVLDANGITISSPKTVAITATQDIKATATGNLALKATADATLDGLSVKATGQTSFAASGNATAELKSSGMLTVQGSLVKIN